MVKAVSESEYIDRIELVRRDRYTIIGWADGFKKYRTRANLVCNACNKKWSTTIASLIDGSGCPSCSKVESKLSDGDIISRIEAGGDVKFESWVGDFIGLKTIATISCGKCGAAWNRNVGGLIYKKITCPRCSDSKKSIERRPSEELRIEQINSNDGVKFIKWLDRYKNKNSIAVCECPNGHQWEATIKHLTVSKSGCPICKNSGLNKSKAGYLYALKSDCGKMVKVGITNSKDTRFRKLSRVTPFGWSVMCIKKFKLGADAAAAESSTHLMLKREAFNSKFDGHTEWFTLDADALNTISKVMT